MKNRWLVLALALVALLAAGAVALWLLGGTIVSTDVRPSPPASANGSPPPAGMKPPPASANGHTAPIFDTVYAFLRESQPERPGYGLYSYALIPAETPRGKRLLQELFRTTIAADDSRVEPKRLNIVYLPVREAWSPSWRPKSEALEASAGAFLHEAYDFPIAQKLLSQLCGQPAEAVRKLCAGDLSRGPYLLTYVNPISAMPQFPPPYLVLDLSDVHEAAFGEFIAAYKAQIKRTDYSDRERIDTFRLELLKIVVPAADWVGPVLKAVSDILHTVKD